MDVKSLLEKLFDQGTNTGAGFGKIAGNQVCAYAQDSSVKSGAVNKNAAAKMKKIYANAVKFGAPLVSIFDSKGGEIGEGHELIDAYSEIIANCARLSGVVPLISVVLGQCGGVNAALCRMSDFVIAVENAEIFFTPPFLGGKSENIADIVVKTTEEAVLKARELLSVLPPNNLETAPCSDGIEIELGTGIKLETLGGITAGLVTLGEKPSAADTAKIARFVSFCDSFSLPVITTIDCDGFEADVEIRDTARLAQVYAGATAPKITLITGNAAGAAFILTGGFNSDFIIAYENAVISPLPVKTAATFLEMPEEEYIQKYASVQAALEKSYIDLVITPEQTQNALLTALEATRNKRVAFVPRKKGMSI
jgi:acetyl-CoA carboxylase carboxyltransferase component